MVDTLALGASAVKSVWVQIPPWAHVIIPQVMTKTTITHKPDGSVSFKLTFPAKTIATEYQKVLVEVAATAEIKGFRKGKAPLPMVEASSDQARLYSHVLDHLLSPAYSAVIHEHQLAPLTEPQVTPKTMKQDQDWVMSVEVATAPVFKLADYQKLIQAELKKHGQSHPRDEKETPEHRRDHQLNVIFDALLNQHPFSISPFLIELETKAALSRLATQLSSLKLSVEDYAKSIKKTPDGLVIEYKKTAETNLRLEFILQAITRDQKLKSRKEVLDFLSGL